MTIESKYTLEQIRKAQMELIATRLGSHVLSAMDNIAKDMKTVGVGVAIVNGLRDAREVRATLSMTSAFLCMNPDLDKAFFEALENLPTSLLAARKGKGHDPLAEHNITPEEFKARVSSHLKTVAKLVENSKTDFMEAVEKELLETC